MVASVWRAVRGTGTDIVVLHGWGLNANIWTPVVEPLAREGRLHRLDLPGYGDSPWPDNYQLSFENLCRLTLEALPEKCHLIGWSLGGLVATQLALSHPERFHSLTTVASSPYFPAQEDSWPGIEPHILNTFAKQLSKDFKRTVERFLALQSLGSPHARDEVKQIKEWLFAKPMASAEVLDAGLDMLATVDLRQQLKNLQVPLLRIYGRLDALVPVAVAEQVTQLLPAKLATQQPVIAPHCSHAPFISDTVGFIAALRPFLQQINKQL